MLQNFDRKQVKKKLAKNTALTDFIHYTFYDIRKTQSKIRTCLCPV